MSESNREGEVEEVVVWMKFGDADLDGRSEN
jgi:hypothetical protein